MNVTEIRNKLSRNDQAKIAKKANCSDTYVHLLLKGERNPETRKARTVIQVAKMIIAQNEELDKLATEEVSHG